MIHPSAIIEPGARIGENVKIGPFCIIGPEVEIGDNTELYSNVRIVGKTKIGSGNRIFSGTVIGEDAQDVHFNNPEAEIIIGDNNIFRENCTVHKPKIKGEKTIIGNKNYFMVNVHIAHDCIVGNNIVIVNNSGLAGHVTVDDNAMISGLSMVHQFTRIGSYAMIGGVSKVTRDIPPFTLVNGNPATVHGLNAVGLRRAGMSESERRAIRSAFKILYLRGQSAPKAVETIEKELLSTLPEGSNEKARIDYFVNFLKETKRGIAFHESARASAPVEE